jgi:RNA ligase (TIGR02306 family)
MGWFRELGNRPRGKFPYYDIENFRRYADLFEPGELVLVTEKVHGANALYTCKKDWLGRTKIYMRSRTMWKWRDRRDWWQDALRNTPSLERFLRAHPGWTVYGEVYGRGVQELDYGVASPHFVAFDIWGPAPCGRCSICLDYSGGSCHSGIGWMTQSETLLQLHRWGVPTVPVLETGPYQGLSWLVKLTTDTFFGSHSMLADRNGNPNQISEGIVIQSLTTRKILKLVSDKYLEKAQ